MGNGSDSRLSIFSIDREMISAGRRRRSFSTDGLKSILNDAISLQPSLHLF